MIRALWLLATMSLCACESEPSVDRNQSAQDALLRIFPRAPARSARCAEVGHYAETRRCLCDARVGRLLVRLECSLVLDGNGQCVVTGAQDVGDP